MKILTRLLLLTLGLSLATKAQADFELQCHTFPLTTSLEIYSKGEETTVRVTHFNGIQYMPFHSGLVTMADIDYLAKQAQVLKSLPNTFVFKGRSENCEWISGFKGKCFDNEDHKIGTMTTDGFHLMVMEEQTEIMDYKPFRSILTRLSLRIDGQGYSLPMEYTETDCILKK